MAVILLQNDAGSAIVFASFLIVFYREGFNSWVYVALGMVVFLFVFSFLWNPATLLADGPEIWWVVGYRRGESGRVGEDTKAVLQIQIGVGKEENR